MKPVVAATLLAVVFLLALAASAAANPTRPNPISAARQDLATGQGYSPTMLVRELRSQGYSPAAAAYAVSHMGADWNVQAVIVAKEFLTSGKRLFTRDQMLAALQLKGFTYGEADYAERAVMPLAG
jgi:hypothetical protein